MCYYTSQKSIYNLTTKIVGKFLNAGIHKIVYTIIEMRSIVTKKWKNLWAIIFNGIHYIINFFTFLNTNNRIKKLMSCFEFLRLFKTIIHQLRFLTDKMFPKWFKENHNFHVYFIWEKIENTSLKLKSYFENSIYFLCTTNFILYFPSSSSFLTSFYRLKWPTYYTTH